MSVHPARCALAVAIVKVSHEQKVTATPLKIAMRYVVDLEARVATLEARVKELDNEVDSLTGLLMAEQSR